MKDSESDMSMDEILKSIKNYVNSDLPPQRGHHTDALYLEDDENEVHDQEEEPKNRVHLTDRMAVSSKSKKAIQPQSFANEETPEKNVSLNPFDRLHNALHQNTPPKEKEVPKEVKQTDTNLSSFLSDLARPMIQKWIDENLEFIVHQKVDHAIEQMMKKNRT